MAGENALLMSMSGVQTMEWTATKDVEKGDVINIQPVTGVKDNLIVFALNDAKMGERCTAVTKADLVRVNTPNGSSNSINWRSPILAGLSLRYTNKFVRPNNTQLQRGDQIVGRLHQDKPADAVHMYISWEAE